MSKTVDPIRAFRSTFTPDDDELEIDPKDKKEEGDKKDIKKEDPPKKKEKEDNIAELRTARDKALAEKKALEDELKELRSLKPLKKVADHLKTKKGKQELADDDVEEFISVNRERKKSVEDLKGKLKNKDQEVKQLEIERSDEWKSDFIEPIKKSAANIYTIFANIDGDGKVKEEDLTKALMRDVVALDDKGNAKTPIEIKAAIARFKKIYEEKTGLDYEAPKMSEITSSIEDYHSKCFKADKAKKEWQKTLEEREKERVFESSQKQSAFTKKELESRDYLFGKFVESEEFKSMSELAGEEVVALAKEEHAFLQSGLRGDPEYKQRGYESLVTSLAKARAYDIIGQKLKAAQAENESLKKKLKSGLPPSKGFKGQDGEKDEEMIPKDKFVDPITAFK